jgi:hypothetical protein
MFFRWKQSVNIISDADSASPEQKVILGSEGRGNAYRHGASYSATGRMAQHPQ